jgi:hypothetical protein
VSSPKKQSSSHVKAYAVVASRTPWFRPAEAPTSKRSGSRPTTCWTSSKPRVDAYLTTRMTTDLAANTAVSFTTTATWQAYAGENTLRYVAQVDEFRDRRWEIGPSMLRASHEKNPFFPPQPGSDGKLAEVLVFREQDSLLVPGPSEDLLVRRAPTLF